MTQQITKHLTQTSLGVETIFVIITGILEVTLSYYFDKSQIVQAIMLFVSFSKTFFTACYLYNIF